MTLPFKKTALLATLATLAFCPAQAELIISEFVADSAGTILDSDGDDSDWIELHNPTGGTLSTAGLFLTDEQDQPSKWALPSVDLAPLEYLIVFASGKDRSDPTGELHTNFSLSASGEYLGLIDADGVTPIAEFADEKRQFFGTAFGFGIPEDADVGTAPQIGYLASPTPGMPNAA
ncbi:lamin tail domain-containing protein, partial [Verrucomicrobiales bacterium]|nr:lamin tail domain-containing protein [Verrucomicrobiales bacterium]